MQILTGKEVSDGVRSQLAVSCTEFVKKYGYAPTLAVILVGNDPASESYVAGKKKACLELGFGHKDYHLPADTTQEALISLVTALNADSEVHGILVQMPLPSHLDEDAVIQAISVDKDVDGFHPQSVGNLLIGHPGFVSCTPQARLEMPGY